jgi:hypothetical protein
MNPLRLAFLGTLAALAANLGAASVASAVQLPPEPPKADGDHAAIHKEMDKLFKEIELHLRDIDRRLYDAGAGKTPKEPVTDAGIDKLLVDARDRGQGVKRDIDRLLELAASHAHAGGT